MGFEIPTWGLYEKHEETDAVPEVVNDSVSAQPALEVKGIVFWFSSELTVHTGHVHAARAAGPRAMKQQGRPRGSSRSGMHRPESLKSQRVKLNDLEVDNVM